MTIAEHSYHAHLQKGENFLFRSIVKKANPNHRAMINKPVYRSQIFYTFERLLSNCKTTNFIVITYKKVKHFIHHNSLTDFQ